MCGNGIRCVGKYVHDKGYTDKTHLTVETRSGVKTLDLRLTDGKVTSAAVDMGTVTVAPETTIRVDGETVTCTPVDVGNPHAVIFVDDAEAAPLTALGPAIEHHEAFPGGVNVEFVQVLERNALRMRVWERGSGVTLACGTGACASAAAAVHRGACDPDTEIRIHLDGGMLRITVCTDGSVQMEGPCEFVYEGDTEIC